MVYSSRTSIYGIRLHYFTRFGGSPVMMVGLYAMELVPKAAAGAASGLTGTFSYVGGATIATLAIGIIIDHFGWGVAFIIFGISGFAAIVCTLLSRDKSLEYW
ncbi:TPA: hypothetical protein ACGMVN_000252 [Streptococcus agalactiae]